MKITNPGVPDGSVTTVKIVDDAVTSAKISAGAVGPSEVSTLSIADMTLTAPVSSGGPITIGAAGTIIADVNAGTVNAGDIIFAHSYAFATNGATAGRCEADILQTAGDAVIMSMVDQQALYSDNDIVAASTLWRRTCSGEFRVVTSGVLTLSLKAYSIGSDSVNGYGQIAIRVLRA